MVAPTTGCHHGGYTFLGVDVDPKGSGSGCIRVHRQNDGVIRRAKEMIRQAREQGKAVSLAGGKYRRCFGRIAARRTDPDVLTDQTSAHDPLNGYVLQA